MPTRLRLALAAVLGLALVGGVAWAGWAWRHPHVLPDRAGLTEFLSPAKVGETAYFDAFDLDASLPRMRFRSATPEVEVNTAQATIELLVCTPKRSRGGGGIGAVSGRDGRRYCDFEPVTGDVVDPGTHRQVIVAITPHRAGLVRVRGIEIRYDSGWRTGTQRVEIGAGLRAR